MGTWLLVRHGSTRSNTARRLLGERDEALDYEGRWHAVGSGRVLRGCPPPPLLLCSDLLRTRQSAMALATVAGWPTPDNPAWLLHPALRERRLGGWEGSSYETLRSSGQSERLITWHRRPPGGESLAGLARRLLGFLSALPDEPGLIVSHAGPIRVLQGLVAGLPRAEIGLQRIPHGQVLALDLPPGGWAAVARRISRR